jgi:hypothetical protein
VPENVKDPAERGPHQPDLPRRQHLPYLTLASLELCSTRAEATEPTADILTGAMGMIRAEAVRDCPSARGARRGEPREQV